MVNKVESEVVEEDISTEKHSPAAEDTKEISSEQIEADEVAREETLEKLRREREARAQALTLEIVGDLPYAEVKPPENVLFVCKLNPVTEGRQFSSAIVEKPQN